MPTLAATSCHLVSAGRRTGALKSPAIGRSSSYERFLWYCGPWRDPRNGWLDNTNDAVGGGRASLCETNSRSRYFFIHLLRRRLLTKQCPAPIHGTQARCRVYCGRVVCRSQFCLRYAVEPVKFGDPSCCATVFFIRFFFIALCVIVNTSLIISLGNMKTTAYLHKWMENRYSDTFP